jgi:uncharacterized membrane protein (UPF0182 family)
MIAWMVARMDGDHRGELVVYRFPKQRLVFGPQQIMNRIHQDDHISQQISLWDRAGSEAVLGTLLVIPIEESLIYVCPLYLRSSGGRIPELKQVIVVYESRIAMEPTLDQAIARLSGWDRAPGQLGATPLARAAIEQPRSEAGTPSVAVADPRGAAERAHAAFDRATDAQRRGDWATYGQELDLLGAALEELAPRGSADAGSDALRGNSDASP